jgi:uncharacterized protein (TIGR02246 family)
MKRFALGVVLTLLAAFGTEAWAGDTHAELQAANDIFVTTYLAGDGAALAALYTEDGALLPPGGARVDGREAIAAFWQGAMDSGLRIEKLEVIEVIESGDLAVDVGLAYLTAPDGSGGTTSMMAKYMVAWQRGADGVWRLQRDMWNPDPGN